MYKNNNIKTFRSSAPLFIWICHLGIAIFFYMRGIAWGLEAYYWGALFVILASLPYLRAAMKGGFLFYEPIYLFLSAFLAFHILCMFLREDLIGMDTILWIRVMKILVLATVALLAGYGFGLAKVAARKLPLRNFVIPNNVF